MPNNDSRQHTVATVVTRQQQHHGDEGKSVGGCDSSDSVFPSTDDSVDNDDNDSVWKMVCWIDSKVRHFFLNVDVIFQKRFLKNR